MRNVCFGIALCVTVPLYAQVIDYAIDTSFHTGELFNRGSITDILTSDNNFLVVGMFNTITSPISSGALITQSGILDDEVNYGGIMVSNYLDSYLQYGFAIRRYDVQGIDYSFRFEFQKPAYSGGLSNKALDALVMPDDQILVAGRFFTDSTLIGTPISSQGLRQLCLIDSTGAPVPGFPMLRCEWPTDSEINSIRQLSTGEYIISGSFNEVDGHPYPKLAKLNADFSVNTEFQPVFEPNESFLGAFAQFIDSQDRIWISHSIDELVLAAAPSYTSNLIRILPNGEIDWSYAAPDFTWHLSGTYEEPGTLRHITANVIEDEDNTFILYGAFVGVNGQPLRRLIKVNDEGEIIDGAFDGLTADSALWSNYNTLGGAVMGTKITVIKKLPDGKLLIGGQFSSFGGEPYSCLVRLQPNGFVGTNDKEGRGKLKVWPNPAGLGSAGFRSAQSATVRIALPNSNEQMDRVEIVDLQGRIVRGYPGDEISNELDLNGLNAGIYLVRAWSENGVYTQKLVLQ